MTKSILATFWLLIFLGNQVFAANCAQVCGQSDQVSSQSLEKTSGGCHDSAQDTQNQKTPAQHKCEMANCDSGVVLPEDVVSQTAAPEQLIKKLIEHYSVDQALTLAAAKSLPVLISQPVVLSKRLHHMLQMFLI